MKWRFALKCFGEKFDLKEADRANCLRVRESAERRGLVMVKQNTKGEKGFTLIEVLIVVVVIGILAAIAVPQFSAYRIRAFDAACLSDVQNLKKSLELYYSDKHEYPVFNGDIFKRETAVTTADGLYLYTFSNKVQGTIQSETQTYAFSLMHLQGSKLIGSSSDSSSLFSHSTSIGYTLTAPDVTAFQDWNVL